nr:MAG TPA: hypothetical protein [Caudoviricetes sp.]
MRVSTPCARYRRSASERTSCSVGGAPRSTVMS